MTHQQLEVYKLSILVVKSFRSVLGKMPRGFGKMQDQIKRASTSIPLNIAEGTGKLTVQDKKKFYAIARGSAQECLAILDVIDALEIKIDETKETRPRLESITKMLSKLISNTRI